MIKVSVIMPVYNVEEYLAKCLESVTGQTLQEIEIICVDDGSTDSSPQILQRFAEADKRIKIISKKNTGYGHSVNRGIEEACGQYISIVETDDYIDPAMLEELYGIASQYKLDVIKADSRDFIVQNGEEQYHYRVALGDRQHDLYRKVTNYHEDIRVFQGYVYTWAGIYRRDFLNENHIRHNESPGASYQDNGFWFQTTMYAKKMYFIDQAYYNLRRDNPNSSIHSKEKVFCICDEYDFIREKVLASGLESEKELLRLVFYYRFLNYAVHMRRMDAGYWPMFLDRMKRDYTKALLNGEIDAGRFTRNQWSYLYSVIVKEEVSLLEDDPLPFRVKQRLEQASDIMIYGAGYWGMAVFGLLGRYNLCSRIDCFIVSKKEGNPQLVCNMKVFSLEECELTEKALVILAVGDRYIDEVKQKLEARGHANYLTKNELLG